MSYGTAGPALSAGRVQDQRLILCERVLGIDHARKVEPVRRRDRAAGGAVTRREGRAHLIGGPCACADAFQRADEAAHLIVKEGPRGKAEMHLGPGGRGALFDLQPVEGFHRARGLADGGAKVVKS